jgi:tetratricopeptide (TPR) repeat protein
VRAELEATALVRVDTDIEIANRPYIRFHPTLPYAVGGAVLANATASQADADDGGLSLADQAEIRQRFIAVYHALIWAIDRVLRGSDARVGMEMLAWEETNVRTAVRWAVAADQFDVAVEMGNTFRLYLEMSARLRARDQWSAWLADAATHTTFSAAVAAVERNRAWSLAIQGHDTEAIQILEALIERLQQTTAFDAAFQLADARMQLGRIYCDSGHAERAIPIFRQTREAREQLVRQAADLLPSETIEHLLTTKAQEASQRRGACVEELHNLATALDDLANALRRTGRFDEARSMAEQGVSIFRALGRYSNVITGLVHIAHILREQGCCYQEADTRYDQALEAARRIGYRALEGTILQNQGNLADDMQQYDRAEELYKQALRLFQAANDDYNIMRTCNLFGVVEMNRDRLSEARAWYERCREIAQRRSDTELLAAVTQNIGIVCQKEGNAAQQRGDKATAQQRFTEAEAFLQESLRMQIDRQNKPGEAMSRSQLSRVYLLIGELENAEVHAYQAREINEGLCNLQGLFRNYNSLAQIARARDDKAQAAQWELRRNEVQAELARRAQGGDAADAGLPQQMVQAITQLAVACVQSGLGGIGLPSEAESAIAQLESEDAGPLQPLGYYLRRLATGPASDTVAALATPPAGLPEPLPQLIAQLRDAVRTAAGG